MLKKAVFILVITEFLLSLSILPVKADGLIVPDPCQGPDCITVLPMEQLTVKYHHVTVTIENQIALTHVDQVFFNPNNWTVEGTYVFPLPMDAAVSNFILWIDGKPVEGQVLDANQARQTYEQIVSQMKDPALLEYIGRGAIQARVFPIAPGEERRIELEYSQILSATNGLVQYIYPLNTEKFSMTPLESVSVTVDIHSTQSIRAVYSLTHSLDVDRIRENRVLASYEANNVTPNTDFNLFYSIGETEAFHLMTYRDPFDAMNPDGFFLLMLAPKPDVSSIVVNKDVILVLDHSGSMDGEKFRQAQEATIYILNHLNEGDQFSIIAFSSDIESFSPEMQPANKANDAIQWIRGWGAAGSTDINHALLDAASMAGNQRTTYLIFLTDGLPTWGETDSERILANFDRSAPSNIRVFTFGVGYDVDTYLLDSLSTQHHGLSKYVTEGQNLDEVLSSFYASISTPVLTNLHLDFGGLEVYDIYPEPLPDLFAGGQIVITGRYVKGGVGDIKLQGYVNGVSQTFTFPEVKFETNNANTNSVVSSIPRLWATRKIGYLLSKIRLEGPSQELIDQIVKISVRFGIITPYTSFLVTEPAILGSAEQDRVSEETYGQMMAATPAPSSGFGAVNKAAEQGAMSQAEIANDVAANTSGQVKIVGAKTFVLQNGVWIDTTFDPDTMQTIKVPFLSEQYYKLIGANPEIQSILALGKNVIFLIEGKAYEITAENEAVGSTSTQIAPTLPIVATGPVGSGTTTNQNSRLFPCIGGFLPLGFICIFLKHIL
jgi:Ca-activated chloride channel family protein